MKRTTCSETDPVKGRRGSRRIAVRRHREEAQRARLLRELDPLERGNVRLDALAQALTSDGVRADSPFPARRSTYPSPLCGWVGTLIPKHTRKAGGMLPLPLPAGAFPAF